MVEFVVQSGPQQGQVVRAGSFPFCMGRSRDAHVRIEGPGIWDRHAEVSIQDGRCFLQVVGDATASCDGVASSGWSLRNGESFLLGGVRLRFLVSAAAQRSLKPLEWMGWIALGLVLLVEAWIALG